MVQFLRKVSLVAADGLQGRDLSELHFRFGTRQNNLETPNTLNVRVYNVSENTANQVQKEFSRVILQCGYQDELGLIFDGTLVQVRRGRENPTDTYLDMICADGDAAINFSIANLALAAGRTFADRVAALQRAMAPAGVTAGYIAPLPAGTLPRGKTLYGMARDHLRDIAASTGTSWSIQNGALQILPLDGYLPDEAVVLNSATGMIGLPEQTQDGIRVRCLLNPRIKPGVRVQIDQASIQQYEINPGFAATDSGFLPSITDDGIYVAIVVEHSGDTRGEEWFTDVIAVSPAQGITAGLAQRGYS